MADTIRVYDSLERPSPVIEELVEAVRYKDLIRQLVRRDVLTRYKRSVLGVAWTMLNPLGMMIVLSVAFSGLFRATHAYAAYLLTGIVAWNFFAQTTVAAMHNMVWGGALLHRIYLPRTIFAISSVGAGLVNLALSLVPLGAVLLVTGVPLRASLLLLPVPIVLLACFALGIGLLLSEVAAYFPDVAEMYQILLQAWFYLTPIIYPEDVFPTRLRWLLSFNPLYHLIRMFRTTVYDGRWPGWAALVPAAAIAGATIAAGWIAFAARADELAYRV